MNKKRILNTFLPVIVLVVLMMIGTIFSFAVASASTSFQKADKNWDNLDNKMYSSSVDTYPYDTTGITVSKVSMDVTYGATHSLAAYHGEFPYDAIYDEDDEYVDGWAGYYAEDGTSATGSNPSYGASSTPTAAEYWGSGVSADWFKNTPTAEEVNASGVTSLRLYAASQTTTGFLLWLGMAGYWILQHLAWLAVLIISLIIRAKNLSMDLIMELLHLDKLNDTMTKNFLYDGDHAKLSAFAGFCLIILIFTLAAFAIRWVKGRDKTQGIWEIIGTIALGAIIIGICLTGHLSSLGSTVSTLANKVMYSAAEAISTGGDGDAFAIDITDAERETEVTQMCEMALVNKAFIDLQLCCQFNTNHIDDLKFENFGDSGGSTASSYLSGVSGVSMHDDFNENLGYYYWFANSSATNKTSVNKTYPSTDTQSCYNKMSSMMTYLQVQYNNTSDDAVKQRILTTVDAFASPGGGARMLCLLLFAVVLVMLAVVLFKYALNVVIAKIQLFIALLGMILAGPLILTSNKKLVQTGKAILGMLLVSFMEITVYSIIFDIILYTVCAMFQPTLLALLATFGLLLLLLYFNPVIAQKIKQVMERTERNISPALVDGRRAAKNWAKQKSRDAVEAYDKSGKVVGYDKNGNAILESRKGNALSKLMHTGTNAVFAEGNEHEGLIGMHTKLNKDRQTGKAAATARIRENAEAIVEEKRSAMYAEATKENTAVNNEVNRTLNDAITGTDEHGDTTFDEALLTEEERRMVADHRGHRDELEELQNNGDYQQLLKDKADLERLNAKLKDEDKVKMSEEDAARLADYSQKIKAKTEQIKTEKEKVKEAIKERAAREALAKRGIDYDSAKGGSIDEKIKNATKDAAVAKHKDELEAALNSAITNMSDEVNNTTLQGKIGRGSTQKLNKDAATAQAAAMLQLKQLQNGEDVMKAEGKDSEAKQEIRDIVDKVSQHYDKDKHSADAHVREGLMRNIEEAKTQEDYDAAVEAWNTEVDRQNAAHAEQKAAVKGQYAQAKADAGKKGLERASVQEQLQSAINNHTPKSKTEESSNSGSRSSENDMASVVNAQEAAAAKTTINLKTKPGAQSTPQPQTQTQSQPQAQTASQPAQNQAQPQQQTKAQSKPQPMSMYNNTQAQAPTPSGGKSDSSVLEGLDNLGPQPTQAARPQQSRPQPQATRPTPQPTQAANPTPQPMQNARPQQAQPQPGRSNGPAPTRPNTPPQRNVAEGMYGNTPQQPDMSSVINQRETVSAAEARQGEAMRAQQAMNDIIDQKTQSISHEHGAQRADYTADEARMDAMRQDRRTISGIYGNNTDNNGGRQ